MFLKEKEKKKKKAFFFERLNNMKSTWNMVRRAWFPLIHLDLEGQPWERYEEESAEEI